MLRVGCRDGGDGGGSGFNTIMPRPLEEDFLFPPLFWTPNLTRGVIVRRIVLVGAKQSAAASVRSAIVMPAPLDGAFPSLQALTVLLVQPHRHCHEAARAEADLSVLSIPRRINCCKSRGDPMGRGLRARALWHVHGGRFGKEDSTIPTPIVEPTVGFAQNKDTVRF